MSTQAVNKVGQARYELRNFQYPERPGQHLQFMDKVDGQVVLDGTSVDDVIKVVIDRITDLNSKDPSTENYAASRCLRDALGHLRDRRDRLRAERKAAADAEASKQIAANEDSDDEEDFPLTVGLGILAALAGMAGSPAARPDLPFPNAGTPRSPFQGFPFPSR